MWTDRRWALSHTTHTVSPRSSYSDHQQNLQSMRLPADIQAKLTPCGGECRWWVVCGPADLPLVRRIFCELLEYHEVNQEQRHLLLTMTSVYYYLRTVRTRK